MHMAEYDWSGAPCSDDGDGCHDVEERGDNVALGRLRDPFNPWDFADVPTPALPMAGAARNGAVSLADVGATLAWVGRVDGGPPDAGGHDYDDDNNANLIDDRAEYDRTFGGAVSGPPDGAIQPRRRRCDPEPVRRQLHRRAELTRTSRRRGRACRCFV
jgi:hypothetical protein